MVRAYFSYTWTKVNNFLKFCREFHSRIRLITKKKHKFGSVTFVIFLHTFNVPLFLISAAAYEKTLCRQNWVELCQKFAKKNVFEMLWPPN